MINLLSETLDKLKQCDKSIEDIKFVVCGDQLGSWEAFAARADIEYDEGFGGNEISGDLKIAGADWWLERGEYDGSEWWEFKTLPIRPANPTPLENLMEG